MPKIDSASPPPPTDEVASRTDELLLRFIHDSDSLDPDEMMELAATILEKSLAKRKYRHVAISAVTS